MLEAEAVLVRLVNSGASRAAGTSQGDFHPQLASLFLCFRTDKHQVSNTTVHSLLLIYSYGAHSLVGTGRALPSLGKGVWMLPTQ